MMAAPFSPQHGATNARPTAAETRLVDPWARSVTASPALEIRDEDTDVVDARFGADLHGFAFEQTDGAPDVGHRLTVQLLGLFQRLDGVVDVAVLRRPSQPVDSGIPCSTTVVRAPTMRFSAAGKSSSESSPSAAVSTTVRQPLPNSAGGRTNSMGSW